MTLARRFPRLTRAVDHALLIAAVPWAFVLAAALAWMGRRRRED